MGFVHSSVSSGMERATKSSSYPNFIPLQGVRQPVKPKMTLRKRHELGRNTVCGVMPRKTSLQYNVDIHPRRASGVTIPRSGIDREVSPERVQPESQEKIDLRASLLPTTYIIYAIP